jgi:signal peptidase I
MDFKTFLKKAWYFIWESDSILSWIINIGLAFVIIKFVVYPGLGFLMQTDYPIVAVVSGSMEHKTPHPCVDFNKKTNECLKYDEMSYYICDKKFDTKQSSDFDSFWNFCGKWYLNNTKITREEFLNFRWRNGFNTGDIMVLRGVKPEKIEVGDTIVYFSRAASYPIIHRVVEIKKSEDNYTFITKGDHNAVSDYPVDQNQLLGRAIARIPMLGWIKISAVKLYYYFIGA